MIPVANAAQIPVNSAKVVKYYNKSVIILHTATGEFKAFSATCTHLGCNVSYEAPLQRFHCFCHDSIYDLNGKNVSGPARFPLAPYQIDIKNDQVNVAQV
jgi:Rieske Fe-S protein